MDTWEDIRGLSPEAQTEWLKRHMKDWDRFVEDIRVSDEQLAAHRAAGGDGVFRLAGSHWKSIWSNVLFEVRLTDRVQWLLSHLGSDARDRIVGCIQALRRNPYRDLEERVTLVWPLERVYQRRLSLRRLGDRLRVSGRRYLADPSDGNLYY